MKIKNLKLKILLSLLLFLIINQKSSIINLAYAQTMTNGSYTIEEGNLNSFAGQATGTNYTVSDTGGGLAPGIYEGPNYKIRANFGYGGEASTSGEFSFSISNTSVNFGTITPGEPITRANTLTVSSPNAGYQITGSENHPLENTTNATIPNTTCDSGNCNQAISGIWISPLTYGFGYRCDNLNSSTDCAQGFSTTNYFKSFANTQTSQNPQIIMSNSIPVTNHTGQISYKLNISGSQPAGLYQNAIQYIAIPSL